VGDVLFDTGRAQLNPGAASKMDQLAQFLTQHPDRRAEIDALRTAWAPTLIMKISRTASRRREGGFVTRGIDPSRINTQGYGKAYP